MSRLACVGLALAFALVVALLILLPFLAAFAQDAASVAAALLAPEPTQPMDPETWYALVCGDDGLVFKFLVKLLYPAIAVAVASILANFKTLQAIPVLGTLLNVIGANWANWLRAAARRAAAPPLPSAKP